MPERQRRRHRALSSLIVEQDLQSSACTLCDGCLAIRGRAVEGRYHLDSSGRRLCSTLCALHKLWGDVALKFAQFLEEHVQLFLAIYRADDSIEQSGFPAKHGR